MSISKPVQLEILPTEIIIEIITNLSFNTKTWKELRSVPRISDIVHDFERSITKDITAKQLPNAIADFPPARQPDYEWLATCLQRYDVIDEIMDLLVDDDNYWPVEPQNMSLVSTGLLLLYRLQENSKCHSRTESKLQHHSPPESLRYLVLHAFTLILEPNS